MTLWDGSYPFYPGANACFPFDTTRAVIVTIFLSMLATSIIILPGIRGRGRLFWFLRLVLGLFMGAVILTVQFTRDWETGWVQANTSYKSFSPAQVNVDIGLHIGLAGVNVTLRGEKSKTEHSQVQRSLFSAAGSVPQLHHSSHYTLVWVVRDSLAQAVQPSAEARPGCPGLYPSIGIWRLAFCTWLISILLFSMSILLYGGHMLLLTATLTLFSLLFFSTARSPLRCPIQFGSVSLRTDYGESFWLTAAAGLLCLLLGLGILILNSVQPEKLKLIFSLDKSSKEERWDKSCLPAEPSCSAQDGLMVPLSQLCHGAATQL
ncbi:DOXA1 factor, partial [Rhadina sibilatrix]|nr:DOXA1 factor [Rhadina sibilatrix]